MPFLLLLAGVAALYAYFRKPTPLALPAGLQPYANDLSGMFGAQQAISPTMTTGQSYLFQVLSPLAAQDLASALAVVGASVLAMPVSVGPNEWAGAFTWQGPQGEPTEHLQNVTWLGLVPAPIEVQAAASGTSVSGTLTGGSPYVPPGGLVRRPAWDPHGEDASLRAGFGLPPQNGNGGGCSSS